ncbi:MAG TPA: phosphate-binding protein [Desulfotomaculum sp.]|nr:phosphate-binding protein [Desulfotomaculum sp.]
MHLKVKNRLFLLLLTSLILAALVLSLSGCGQSPLKGAVTVGGSTTVQPVAEKWAKAFETKNANVKITVQGGGSSAGIKGCAEGIFDIGAASRELKPNEIEQWPDLKATQIAGDGVAIVVHPSNSTADLSLEKIRDIFAAGSNTEWTVINREEGSGTRDCFEEKVMAGAKIAPNAEFSPSTGAVKQKVAGTTNAIGYISLGHVDSSVKALSIDGIACSEDNVLNKSYPISRYLNFITKGEPKELTKNFIDFCLSTEGQNIVKEEGYITIK